VKTLRLLLWLRWKLYTRASSVGNRVVTLLTSFILLAALSPLWIGGAVGAYRGVMSMGGRVMPIVFALTQIVWIWLGLVLGALGRSFDLDKLLRYPVRPRTVYAMNVLLTPLEPIGLMTLPTLGALAYASAIRGGVLAGLGVALAGVLVTWLTAAVLQLLLALLDDLLRREWMRYIAAFAIPLTFMGIQIVIKHLGNDVALGVLHQKLTADQAVDMASRALAWIPTTGLPAMLARGALEGHALVALGGLAGSIAMLALALAPGAALMRLTSRAGGDLVTKRASANAKPGRGTFAMLAPPLPRGLGLLLGRELRYTIGHPQRLLSLIVTPAIIILFYAVNDRATAAKPAMFLFMMGSSLSATAMTMFSYDGPGIRTFFLLPVRARDVILVKNLEFMIKVVVEIAVVIGALTFMNSQVWSVANSIVLLGAGAVIVITAVIGTMVSIRWPMRARQRGMSQRQTGWGGLFSLLSVLGVGGLTGVLLWAAQKLAGPVAGIGVALVLFAGAIAIWWISLERCAGLFLSHREKLIETLAKVEDV
jgi:hypothetical protein